METIYYKDHHEIYQQWVGLTYVTDSSEGVQGYLQVTIVVLGPKDEIYVHPESEVLAGSGSLMDVMMVPQIDFIQCDYVLIAIFSNWMVKK